MTMSIEFVGHKLATIFNDDSTEYADKITLEDLQVVETLLKHSLLQQKCDVSDESIQNDVPELSFKKLLNNIDLQNVDVTTKIISICLTIHFNENAFAEVLNKMLSINNDTISLKMFNIILNDLQTDMWDHFLWYLSKYISYEKSDQMFFLNSILRHYINNSSNVEHIIDKLWHIIEENNDFYMLHMILDHDIGSTYLIKQDVYWTFLQKHLIDNNLNDKIAIYTFAQSVDSLKKEKAFSSDKSLIKFTVEEKEHYFTELDYYTILLKASSEKQVHLVQPTLSILTKIMTLDKTWLFLIYHRLLKHSNKNIVSGTLIILFQSNLNYTELYKEILNALNSIIGSTYFMQTFNGLEEFINTFNEKDFNIFIQESLIISWTPSALWHFYKTILFKVTTNPQKTTEISLKTNCISFLPQILSNTSKIPHKYIRNGLTKLICENLAKISSKIDDLLPILLFLNQSSYNKCYVRSLIASCTVEPQFKDDIINLLNSDDPDLNKIDLIVEIINNKLYLTKWIYTNIYKPFLLGKFNINISDRITNIYLLRTADLNQYLYYRLQDRNNIIYDNICLTDKPDFNILKLCEEILLKNNSTDSQILLAFDILYHSYELFNVKIFKFWQNQFLNSDRKFNSNIALSFLHLLEKLHPKLIDKNIISLKHISDIYLHFFDIYNNDVISRIFYSYDLILPYIKAVNFFELSFRYLKKLHFDNECFENGVRNFVRSIAFSFSNIDKNILKYLLQEFYKMSLEYEIVAYYFLLYFKRIKLDDDVFPKYTFVDYDKNSNKEDKLYYDICRDIYLLTYQPNPYFRKFDIRQWAMADILLNVHHVHDKNRIQTIVNKLIEKYKINFGKRHFLNSQIHLEKLRILQQICVFSPFLLGTDYDDLTDLLLDSLCRENNQISIRRLIQSVLIILLQHYFIIGKCPLKMLKARLCDANKTTQTSITAFVPLLYGLQILCGTISYSVSTVETMLPWTMGPHFKLRAYSQVAIQKIYERRTITGGLFRQKFETIYSAIKFVTSQQGDLNAATMEAIENELKTMDYICGEHLHLTENLGKLLTYAYVKVPHNTGVLTQEYDYYKLRYCHTNHIEECTVEPSEDDFNLSDTSFAVQLKIAPEKPLKLTVNDDSDDLNLPSLLVIATLVESTANLGGLCRTCEIFGASGLVMHDAKFVTDKQFQALSMSSEHWVHVEEVKQKNLTDYLSKLKENGCYNVVGAEQTSDSTNVADFVFPKRTALVLGNEKSGIPPNIMPFLDYCVELPQFGVLRSLNVHVAGALLIWEYTKQFKK